MVATHSPPSVRIDQYLFGDDGKIPNNRELPVLVYRSVLDTRAKDAASACEHLFARHRWTGAWRNGIYNYDHFHVTAHEVLGIVRGQAKVRFGGAGGLVVEVRAGDVVVIPAGVGHRNMGATPDLLVIGAYPDGDGEPEICTGGGQEHDYALERVAKVPRPAQDPVFGEAGPLLDRWRS